MVPTLACALKECCDNPRIAYIGAASGDNIIFFRMVKSLLKQAWAAEVVLVRLAKNTANISAAKQALETSDAIFISGGEVDDGMYWLKQHGLVEYLKELRIQGKLFFGVSAGSIMMGSHWVHWNNPKDDTTAELFDCLGFVSTTFDTHAEDEDWKELKIALQLKGDGERGYGIPRDGMVIVDSQGNMNVFGENLICYINNRGCAERI